MALTQISTQGIKDGTITGTDLATNVDLVDDQKIRFGTGNDLEIYHDGSHSRIDDTGTGDLRIRSDKLQLQNPTGEEYFVGNSNGSVELYHNDVKKFETASTGVTVTGTVAATSYTGDGSSLTGVASTVADGCIYENSQTISNNYTITTNKNAMSAGPITVASGATLTIPSGSTYTIV